MTTISGSRWREHNGPPSRSRFLFARSQSRLFADVPGGAHGKDAFITAGEQYPFEKAAALIVKKVFEPAVLHQLRDHHNDAAVRMLFREVEDELNNRNDNE